jgi:hypothetical protein
MYIYIIIYICVIDSSWVHIGDPAVAWPTLSIAKRWALCVAGVQKIVGEQASWGLVPGCFSPTSRPMNVNVIECKIEDLMIHQKLSNIISPPKDFRDTPKWSLYCKVTITEVCII